MSEKGVNEVEEFISTKPTDKNILVLDDSEFMLDYINETLRFFYTIHLARTPLAAFGMLHKAPVDLALLDIAMPGMNGLEFFEHAKKEIYYQNTKTIFITSSADSENVRKALLLGADGYILKPFEASALLAKVKEVLG
ncbi:MAG: response regulator [Spirochaetaceae bacterium]|jgi:CheY-like chemotaxis protein|nr:response regulator [Spirochaetaceae bacterium]